MRWYQRLSKSGSDRLVAFASGETPIKQLDQSRTAFRMVAILAGVAFLGSGWILWRTISTAAKLPPLPNVNTVSNQAEITALKEKDTDGDGLSNYDELFTYGSSPYLFSSAGDEISDGEKIRNGQNPNCPRGQSCDITTITIGNVQSDDTVSVSYLRQVLKLSGAPAATVDAADDAAIIAMYQQATKAAGTSSNTNAAPSLTSLSGLNAAEIRSLLQQNGVDATTLNSVDDKTLEAVYQEIISSNQ